MERLAFSYRRNEPYLLVVPTLVTVKSGKVKVPILNLVGKTAKLPSKEMLGTWTPLDEEMDILDLGGDLERERMSEWLDQIRVQEKPLCKEGRWTSMDDKDKELLVRLLRNYLEPKEGCPPATTLGVGHHINTGAAPPIKIRPRRYSRVELEVIDAEAQRMLHDGVIGKGTGAWGLPVVLVRKKDGTVRFCIDYRILNVYPLPRIDEYYARITEVLESGPSRRLLAELILFGLLHFGLVNAPGTFQRMMDAVPRGLIWKCCLVYLDDVIIFTAGSVSRHVAGLSLKLKKCSFAKTRLDYLGTSSTNTIKRFPTPENPEEVQRFVHLAGYYRLVQQEAFKVLKAELTEIPLLAYPDFTKPFKLVTDASVVGLTYASKVNSPTAAKYGITDLECAAVIWALKLFRPYLYGRRFELVTDHSALSYLMKKKDLTGRPYRCALQLQEFDFRIIYRGFY
ncbi:LOW QUALITY PROTEIN: Gag-pol fusion protein [Phytophthora megakarya]|uniref:Gag-pol fusion protein n=1 Tax=Phytophthora megakarya TaxID=4795 RepID=A0A225VCL9_9STRA|nr:LOW QUALITY PROTEIN: Gag-pol fusion protein [Phytophthora megakarya]